MSVPQDSIRIPLVSARVVRLAFLFSSFISPESNSGSKHRSLGWMPSNNAYIVWHLLYPKSFIHLPKYYSAPSRHQNPFGNTYKIEFKCQICKNFTKKCIFLQKYLHSSKISCNFATFLQIWHLKSICAPIVNHYTTARKVKTLLIILYRTLQTKQPIIMA